MLLINETMMPPTVEFVFIFYFLQILFQFVALPFNMSQPLVISAHHKLCFAHTTLITGGKRSTAAPPRSIAPPRSEAAPPGFGHRGQTPPR